MWEKNMWNLTLTGIMKMFHSSNSNLFCPANCSGHGDCHNGTCICEVQYKGGECSDYNNAYFIAFGIIFYLLSIICTVQLVLCIRSEFQKAKNPSWAKVMRRVTTQKLIYVFIILAALSRGLYFSLQQYMSTSWASNLLSIYYPLLLSCCSLIVCFWAEAFHLTEKEHNNPGFLSKSFLYFILFNILLYILLIAQFVATEIASDKFDYLIQIFNGCFATLMVVVLVFFLAYGVEVFFKVKGAFADASMTFDFRTLHLSRFGLVFQGALQICTAFFLMLSVTAPKWKDDIPILKRNIYDVLFRMVELGVAVWFPCVLWKSQSPETLWILNPTKLLRQTTDEEQQKEKDSLLGCRKRQPPSYQSTDNAQKPGKELECWICYDMERTDAGPIIEPCQCKGDVGGVHHECLRRWLLEVMDDPEALRCKVCKSRYHLKDGPLLICKGFQLQQVFLTFFCLGMMAAGPTVAYYVYQEFPSNTANIISIGGCVLLEMACFKYLGMSIVQAYQRAKIRSIRIVDKKVHPIKSSSKRKNKSHKKDAFTVSGDIAESLDSIAGFGTSNEHTTRAIVETPPRTLVVPETSGGPSSLHETL
ncbi:uncharacterized protein [Amphiura filiformis]|uniref:uncharacterized protein n=1 Tax=Amphiura filiformis TaxID=82378 RepID=UPI003B21FBCF